MAGDKDREGLPEEDGFLDADYLNADYRDEDYEYDSGDLDDEEIDFADVVDTLDLPGELPALRLAPIGELVAQARSAPLMNQLAALAEWVADAADGRPTDATGDLSDEDAADAARAAGVSPDDFAYLWEYALAADWLDFAEELDEDAEFEAPAIGGETADEWARDRAEDVMSAWCKTLTGVLTATFDVATDIDPLLGARMDFYGQGIAMAVMLFLARGEGLPLPVIREALLESATSGNDHGEAAEVRGDWLRAHGDPAGLILGKLAGLGAVTLPRTDDGAVRLTPLGLAAVFEELVETGIQIPLLPAATADLTAAQLLQVADADEEGFEAESDRWVAARGPDKAARELLGVAAANGPDSRLLAVSVVTRIGQAAEAAWRDSLDELELRPYAKMVLANLGAENAGDAENAGEQPGLEPVPEDLAWLATDMLTLACDDEEPDPEALRDCLGDTVPGGDEHLLFDLMSRVPHPDAVYVLRHIGQHHPDKKVAKQARSAVHKATMAR
jgi:hypothetical protein